MYHQKSLITALAIIATTSTASADQPIMNMMPRWDGGYGWQIIDEHISRRDLLDGNKSLGSGLYENIHKINLEGVYTWDKSIRLTVKIPYILDAERTILDDSGNIVKQTSSGLGDMKLALPLKKYFNEDGYSGNWSITPQLIVPTGTDQGDYTLPNRSWGTGFGASYEVESNKYFFAAGASVIEMHSSEPFEFSTHIDLGLNFLDRGQFLIETDYHWEDDGTHSLITGPALYWRFADSVHARIEWKQSLSDHRGTIDHGNSTIVKAGIGWVF